MTDRTIAFVGMGVMGSPMAINLASAGFDVSVWNRNKNSPRLGEAVAGGCRQADSLADAAAHANLIMTCVSRPEDVMDVCLRDGGLADHASLGALFIDFSTIGRDAAVELGRVLESRGYHFIDAPVSGGDTGAQNGTLSIMAGGKREHLDMALPALQAVGNHLYHCGEVGTGQSLKSCNQVLCAVHALALRDAFRVARRFGVSEQLVIEACSQGAAGSWALANLGPRVVADDLKNGFGASLMLKDLGLALPNNVDAPAAEMAADAFAALVKEHPDVATQAIAAAHLSS